MKRADLISVLALATCLPAACAPTPETQQRQLDYATQANALPGDWGDRARSTPVPTADTLREALRPDGVLRRDVALGMGLQTVKAAAIASQCGAVPRERAAEMIARSQAYIRERTDEVTGRDLADANKAGYQEPALLRLEPGIAGCASAQDIWGVLVRKYGATRAGAGVARPELAGEEASKQATQAGMLLGAAQACRRLTPGDVQYARQAVARRLHALAPAVPESQLSFEIFQAESYGQRGTVGPTDYGCANYERVARDMVAPHPPARARGGDGRGRPAPLRRPFDRPEESRSATPFRPSRRAASACHPELATSNHQPTEGWSNAKHRSS